MIPQICRLMTFSSVFAEGDGLILDHALHIASKIVATKALGLNASDHEPSLKTCILPSPEKRCNDRICVIKRGSARPVSHAKRLSYI